MPKRQTTKKAMSTEIQGKGSWVKYKVPTVAVFRDFRQKIGSINERLEQLSKDGQTNSEEFNSLAKQSEAINIDFMSEYITEWNWVSDEAGEVPMPQPLGNKEVFYDLTTPEMVFLAGLFNPDTKKKTR